MKRLVYISGQFSDLDRWVQSQCTYYNWEFYRSNGTDFPTEYELGINYLGEKKINNIELDKARWVNFHPGPLPEFGGRNLAYHAIMTNANQFGATIHYMNSEFDKGPIIEVKRFYIEARYTAEDLVIISHQILKAFMYSYLPAFLRNEVVEGHENIGGYYYQKSNIDNQILISHDLEREIRAKYCPPHLPYIEINGRKYYLKADE